MMDELLMGVTWSDVISWLPSYWRGFQISLIVTAGSLLFGIPLGLLFALGSSASSKLIRSCCFCLIEVGRGVPALVMLQFIYFGLPTLSISLPPMSAAIVALSWTTGAYTSEIIRAGLEAVPRGQSEAAMVLGLSRINELRYIVVPQAMRIATPALLGFAILIFQGTSLCFAIALPELVSRAYDIGSTYFFYFPALLTAGLFFAAVCIPASFLVHWMERRVSKRAYH